MSVARTHVGAAAALGAIAVTVPTARAEPPPAAHCVTQTLPTEQIRRGGTSPTECFSTFDEALASIGVAPERRRSVTPASAGIALAASGIVAVHYEHTGAAGETLTVFGECNGSGINMGPGDPWNDRISSTRHQLCGTVKHFADWGATGDYYITTGVWGAIRNMNGLLNDRSSSIFYFA
jgi:hypothetical protein